MADFALESKMVLTSYKWIIAALIAAITWGAGHGSLRLIRRYQNLLQIGDALADGIFLGTAIFHLFPDAIHAFAILVPGSLALGSSLLGVFIGFYGLHLLEQAVISHESIDASTHCKAGGWLLAGILSIHAFIAGLAVGITSSLETLIILTIAIFAHKGFECFALMMGLHRNALSKSLIQQILSLFAFITPLGVILANYLQTNLTTKAALCTTGILNALAAGSFLYIGTLHAGHEHFHPAKDPNKRYHKALATFSGFVAMGIVTFWF